MQLFVATFGLTSVRAGLGVSSIVTVSPLTRWRVGTIAKLISGPMPAALPRFPAKVEPTLWYDFGFVYLKFNAATNPEDTFTYRIELTEADGTKTSYRVVSDYYREPRLRQPRICTRVPPHVVRAGGRYRCRIVPEGFFGRDGAACEWSFAIKCDYPLRTTEPNVLPE